MFQALRYFADWQKERHSARCSIFWRPAEEEVFDGFRIFEKLTRHRASFTLRVVQNDSSEEAEKATCSLIVFVFEYPEPGRTEILEIYQGGQRKRHERPHLLFVASLRRGVFQFPFLGATDHKMPPGEARDRDIMVWKSYLIMTTDTSCSESTGVFKREEEVGDVWMFGLQKSKDWEIYA